MLNFPIPYPDELLYSTIARAGIRQGIISPKQLLDEVYGSRKVIATVDLPDQLELVSRWLPKAYNVERLAYEHTLFPLYAPFIPEERRQRCLQWVRSEAPGALHLAMGVAASIVKQPRYIRYCPGCLKEQRKRFGEYYWRRDWQAAGIESCHIHGGLLNTGIVRPLLERHRYHPASPESCPLFVQRPAGEHSNWILKQVRQLLNLEAAPSASYEQWSHHYHSMAQHHGFLKGRVQVDHAAIYDKVLSKWPAGDLRHFGLLRAGAREDESFWLKAIFRKHRKSFSYLQHLIVHHALLPADLNIADVIQSFRKTPKKIIVADTVDQQLKTNIDLTDDQQSWLNLLQFRSPKAARQAAPALYARLYRADRLWLTSTNACQGKKQAPPQKQRVDWKQRDQIYLLQLKEIVKFLISNRSGPRRSKHFLLKRLGHAATLEKNLQRLAQTRRLLDRCSETVAQYQTRRLRNAFKELRQEYELPPRWRLLRQASLSDARLTDSARKYLDRLVVALDENQRDQRQQYRRGNRPTG